MTQPIFSARSTDPDQTAPIGRLRRLGHMLLYAYPPGVEPPVRDEPGKEREKGENASSGDPAPGILPGEVAVRAVWARPLSARGGEISLLSVDHKDEVAWVPSLDEMDAESRALLVDELRTGVFIPRIEKVYKTSPGYGYRYWSVQTEFGKTDFLSRSPETHVLWQGPHTCLIRDVNGNCYEIPDLRELDETSRLHAMRVL